MKQTALKLYRSLEIPHSAVIFAIILFSVVAGTAGALILNDLKFLAIPGGILTLLLVLSDYRALYLLLWASIPISTEMEFGSFGTDFPDELLMLLATGVTILLVLPRLHKLDFRPLLHPITLLLLLHLGWITISTLTSQEFIVSVKYLLAKTWYITPFYALTYILIRKPEDLGRWLRWIMIPTAITVLVVMVRHANHQFSFMTINEVLKPFYRNHVDYALYLGTLLPFVWMLGGAWKHRRTATALSVFLVIAIYFSYTRAAYVGILAAAGAWFLMRYKLLKPALLAATILVTAGVVYLAIGNRYIDYAPQYEKTITHYEFDDLLEATYQLEDISTMERVYRWVAGLYMFSEKPIMGFGPGSFYFQYRSYTDENFVTYVSDNPDKSGTHNYYLMTLVEQGLPGLLIFLALCFVAILRAEWLYHRLAPGPVRRMLVASFASLIFICTVCLLNDMIETDKVGSFFFLSLALILVVERLAAQTPGAIKRVTERPTDNHP